MKLIIKVPHCSPFADRGFGSQNIATKDSVFRYTIKQNRPLALLPGSTGCPFRGNTLTENLKRVGDGIGFMVKDDTKRRPVFIVKRYTQ